MVQGRVHRMTELFGKLAPGATIDQARAELNTVSANMIREHPDAYSPTADTRISAVHLKEQITSGAKTVLLVLLASSLLIFVIACSNVANLILSRSVRREGELAIRAALGASPSALAPYTPRRKPSDVHGRSLARYSRREPDGWNPRALRFALFGARARSHRRLQHALGRRDPRDHRCRSARIRSALCRPPNPPTDSASPAAAFASPAAPAAACASSPSRKSPHPSSCSPAPAC